MDQNQSFKVNQNLHKVSLKDLKEEDLKLIIIYIVLFIVIDISLLIIDPECNYFHFTNLGVNFLMMIIIFWKKKILKTYHFLIIIFITQGSSLIKVFFMQQGYLMIIIIVLEDYQMTKKKLQIIIIRITLKIGSLVLVIIFANLIQTIIISCALIFDFIKLVFQYQKLSKQKIISKISPRQQNKQAFSTICSKQSTWIKSIPNIPSSYVLISLKDQIITFKNQSFYKLFSNFCKNENDFENLIFNKMKYTIISENIQHKNISQNLKDQQQQNKRYFRSINNTTEINKLKSQSLLEICKQFCLKDNIQSQDKTLEFYSNFINDQNNEFIYTGQIIINQNDDEVILTLSDITKQNQVQEERIKDQFQLSIIQSFSHELRTPLNSSLNFLQVCENYKNINEEIKTNFISPAICALRLQSYLINDIIDFNSIYSNSFELTIEDVSLDYIVSEVYRLFQSLLKMKNLALYIDMRKNQYETINSDPSRMIQIITNLLQNSIKYSNSGSIILKISSCIQDCIKISVKDQGLGINENFKNELVEMLQSIREKKHFSDIKNWHGFGLLISTLLLQELGPKDKNQFIIQSKGKHDGTKITFFIQNFLLSDSYSQKFQSNVKITNKKKGSYCSVSRSNFCFQINGKNNEENQILTTNDKQIMNVGKFNSIHSSDDSLKIFQNSEHYISKAIEDAEFELEIGDFQNLVPQTKEKKMMFSPKAKQNNQNQIINDSPQIIDYTSIHIQSDYDSRLQLKQVLEKQSCKCRNVLSVDDEIFNQKSIQYLLKQHGLEVISVFNGEEAIQRILQQQRCLPNCCLFIFILMDYQMPIMNGIDTTKQLINLMENHIIPKSPIIGLTAFNSKNDIELCVNSGMSSVLTKPLRIEELFDILNQL